MTSTNVKDALDEIYAKANSNQIIKRLSATTNEKPGIMTTGTYTSCGGSNYTCSTRTLNYDYSIYLLKYKYMYLNFLKVLY
jgi:hypothetical protein